MKRSHPSWVRGLKQENADSTHLHEKSHPSWVRGLKPILNFNNTNKVIVAPLVGAWIETNVLKYCRYENLSHPSWVRGLKPLVFVSNLLKSASHPSWVRGLKQVQNLRK